MSAHEIDDETRKRVVALVESALRRRALADREAARSGVVGPARCVHCSRAIWQRGESWVHVNGSPHCYGSNGDKRDARPRETQ